MRTINFTDEDIKQAKLSLCRQDLTSLQSAILMQHITNLEDKIQWLEQEIDDLEMQIGENNE